ncbi:hypothetical protein ULVI_06345 [Cochleicola gelatinilyticus]|uniref:Uncharacterized protein n=1 Tax=Cochleicola gelatinilyticus TaxID=1763537 RepID=A0A167JG20_9FLAO|nr:hypothetical protein ULVI_06345 [Cochleicola gelatinilyticus]
MANYLPKKKNLLLSCLLCFSVVLFGQETEEELKIEKESDTYLSEASVAMQNKKFTQAEADYRKAISLQGANETGKYNLGNAYYEKQFTEEAIQRYKQAAQVAEGKPAKHKAFHNLGNAFMKKKQYEGAVESYKNALRNNPTDDETRYNLALAKEMLEKNPPQNDEGGDDNEDKENKDDQENKDKKDEGDNKEGDQGDEKDEKDKGEEEKDKQEGDNEKDKGKPEDKEGEQEQPKQQQPVPGQLSPQQVKNLLDAMNNEEQKVQEKINAQKQKGAKVKSNKDW